MTFQTLYKKTPELLSFKMIDTTFRKLEFTLILFFFSYWHTMMPQNLNYCENRGYFGLLQRTALLLLRITQYWPRHYLEEFTKKRLRLLLRKIEKECPQLMLKHPNHSVSDNFYQLPIIGREELRKNFSDAIKQYEKTHKTKLMIGTTSGTTGIPMRVGVTEKFAVHYRVIRRRLLGFTGLKLDEEFIYPRTASNPHFCAKNIFIGRDLNSIVMSCESFFSVIQERNIKAIYAFPSLLLLMKDYAEKEKIRIPHLNALITAGEDLTPGIRKTLEEGFRTRVFNFYASVELSSIGQECEYGNGFHINPEFHLIEILSPLGEHVPSNVWGRIIITPLDLSIIPILRYDTGDMGMFEESPCPCKRTLPRLLIRGRSSEVITTKKGVISPHAFKEILDRYDSEFIKIKRYQLILDSMSRLTLVIVPNKQFMENDRKNIENICKKYFGAMIDLDVQTADSVHYVGLKAPFFLRRDH